MKNYEHKAIDILKEAYIQPVHNTLTEQENLKHNALGFLMPKKNLKKRIDNVCTNGYTSIMEVRNMKTDNLNIRVDPATKIQAEAIFASFGLTVSDAVNVFLHKSIMERGLPFEVKQPKYDEEIEKDMEVVKQRMANLKSGKSKRITLEQFAKHTEDKLAELK